MCVAVIGQVVSIEKNKAEVDFNGAVMEVSIEFLSNVKNGDYLLVHAGFALEKIKEEQAIDTINTLKELLEVEGIK